ncbi:MAG: RNA 2',3'-cyclic phosphodiesterase [Candidatus Omnitrophota bacterium]|jgi:2'-5' RNA ligase
MRTFIAVELPEEIRTSLSNIQDELKQTRADVKWVKPENIHLTLKFLGEIEQDRVLKIQSILDQIASKKSGFNLYLSSLGAFPKLQYPRVIWIGVENDQPIQEIAETIEKELCKIGLPAETRPFSSHITLGRVRSGLNRKALIEKLEFLNKNLCSPPPEFKVSGLTLFKSTLTEQGPIYEAIFKKSFG